LICIVHDTERWKQELASLASASGLGLEGEDQKVAPKPLVVDEKQHASRDGAAYSTRTGRFNEGTSKSRGRTQSKHATANGHMLFHVPENEREMWVSERKLVLLNESFSDYFNRRRKKLIERQSEREREREESNAKHN
jgi:hypothetical protein